jgi:hypothetical protein
MPQLEVERVEAMMRPVARRAMGGETGDTFDPTAIDKMIALSQHKAKLLGLNAPTRSEKAVFGKRGEPPVGITDDGAAERFDAKVAAAIAAYDAERANRADAARNEGEAALSVAVWGEGGPAAAFE